MSKKCFAITAVTLMLLVAFQAMICPLISADPIDESDSASSDISASPFFGTISPGTVESISSPMGMDISETSVFAGPSYMTESPDTIHYWTSYGTFAISKSRPEFVSLVSLNAIPLVQQSYFTISSASVDYDIANSKILQADDSLLEVAYDITDSSGAIVATMTVSYDFSSTIAPKITARVGDIRSMVDWNVAWIVQPNQASMLKDATSGKMSALSSLSDGKAPAPDLKTDLVVGSESLIVDWSDAKAGTVEVSRADKSDDRSPYVLKVSFPKNEAVIDPSLVGSSSDPNPLGGSYQRKAFWYSGNYWVFYNSGNGIVYRFSADGVTWSSQLSLPGGTTPVASSGFDVAFRSGAVAVSWINTLNQLCFKKGTVINNNIVWSDTVTIATVTANYVQPVSVAIGYDSSFWVGYFDYNLIKVARSFTGLSGSFTYNLLSQTALGTSHEPNKHNVVVLPASADLVAVLETNVGTGDNSVTMRYCSSTGWSTPVSSNIGMSAHIAPFYKAETFSAVASKNGTVHIAFKDNLGSGY